MQYLEAVDDRSLLIGSKLFTVVFAIPIFIGIVLLGLLVTGIGIVAIVPAVQGLESWWEYVGLALCVAVAIAFMLLEKHYDDVSNKSLFDVLWPAAVIQMMMVVFVTVNFL